MTQKTMKPAMLVSMAIAKPRVSAPLVDCTMASLRGAEQHLRGVVEPLDHEPLGLHGGIHRCARHAVVRVDPDLVRLQRQLGVQVGEVGDDQVRRSPAVRDAGQPPPLSARVEGGPVLDEADDEAGERRLTGPAHLDAIAEAHAVAVAQGAAGQQRQRVGGERLGVAVVVARQQAGGEVGDLRELRRHHPQHLCVCGRAPSGRRTVARARRNTRVARSTPSRRPKA